jgi:hypothetical protein
VPVAITEKVAVCPAVTSTLTGSDVIAGVPVAPLGFVMPVVLPVTAAHPENETLATSTTKRNSSYSLVRGLRRERLVTDIWLRLLPKLRAEVQHAPLMTRNYRSTTLNTSDH